MPDFLRRLTKHRSRSRWSSAGNNSIAAFVPGLLLVGLGLGGMLTPSVNVVQSSFPEALQSEI